MDIGNRNAFTERLFTAKATCPNCKDRIIYRSGVELARKCGIYDNVVVCYSCRHVYTCTLIPGSLMLQDDVTARYPGVAAGMDRQNETAGEKTEKPPKEKSGFFSRIFGKQKGRETE